MLESLLDDLSGRLGLAQEDPRWIDLFSRQEEVLNDGFLGSVLMERIVPRLLANNLHTRNAGVLLSLVYSQLKELNQLVVKDASRAENMVKAVCTGLHLVALIHHGLSARLGLRSEVDVHFGLNGDGGSFAVEFVSELCTGLHYRRVASTTTAPPQQGLDDVSFYCANVLLSMLSPQMYSASSDMGFSKDQSVVLSVFSSPPAGLREKFVYNCLSRIMQRPSSGKGSLVQNYLSQASTCSSDKSSGGGLLNVAGQLAWAPIGVAVGLGWGMASLVGMGGGWGNEDGSNIDTHGQGASVTAVSESPIAERCLCVLNLVLQNDRTLQATLGLCEETTAVEPSVGALEGGGGAFSGGWSINLEEFVSQLATRLPDAGHTLLLYSMLHRHPAFMRTLTASTGTLRSVLVGLLHGLYDESIQGSVEHHYLLSVCVLMLSQEADLRASLVATKAALPWYKERNFRDTPDGGVSLADATVLCVLRAMMHVVMRLKDPYLASNYFAIILNLAPFVENIHSYTAERLVGVAHKLARRLASNQARARTGDVGTPLLEETLRVLFRALWLCIKCVGSCINLKYVLARDFLDIETSFSDPYIVHLCADENGNSPAMELVHLSQHYLELVKAEQSSASAKDALAALNEALPGPQDASLSQVVVYRYEEGDGSAAYFVPFAWKMVLQWAQDMHWEADRVAFLPDSGADQEAPPSSNNTAVAASLSTQPGSPSSDAETHADVV